MKKLTMYLMLMLAPPVLLQAQYSGGNGRGDVSLESLNNILMNTGNNNNTIPSSYSLQQNYCNPFNPSTNICYDLPKKCFVKLIVFDALGRVIEILVNENQSPGTYEVIFDGSQQSSGVYFYKLTTDNYTETKRMVLVK